MVSIGLINIVDIEPVHASTSKNTVKTSTNKNSTKASIQQ